jgi:neutral ceramidase
MGKNLLAGVGRAIITPPVGIKLVGFNARIEPSVGIEKDLLATVVIFSDGEEKVAIVGLDICMFLYPTADRIRKQLAGHLGIPEDHVMLNFSHTHSGPLIPDWWEIEPEQRSLQEPYQINLENQLVGAAAEANRSLSPVRIAVATGQVRIGIHRREWYEGRLIIGEDAEGPMDPEVKVIRVDNLDGSPLAIFFSYGCHPVTMGPHSLFISPDYPGVARCTIEQITGAKAIFLQGTAGDISPITGIGAGPLDSDLDQLNRLGNMLAGEVIKAVYSLQTHRRRGERRFWESVSIQSHWPFEPVEGGDSVRLAVRTKKVLLPLQLLPDLDIAEASVEAFRQRLEKSRSEGASAGKISVDESLYEWAKGIVQEVATGNRERSVEAFMQAIRINDIGIVGVPGEPFSGLGMEVKRHSPFENTIFLGYTNGWLGYMPTADVFPPEGVIDFEKYRVPDLLYQNARLPAPPTTEWPKIIVEEALSLLNGLANK